MTQTLVEKWQLNKQLQSHLVQMEKLITERTHHLARSLALIDAAMEATSDGIAVLNNEFNFTDYNKKFLKMLHLSPEIIHNMDNESIRQFILNQLDNKLSLINNMKKAYENPVIELNDVAYFKDGRIMEYFVDSQYIDNQVVGKVISLRDITERKKLEKELEYKVTHDTLTGLANRVLLFDRIQQAISSAKRNNHLLAVLFLDLDYFKRVNDTLGHDIGDEVLRVASRRLLEALRESDTVARFSGDEFVAVISPLEKVDLLVSICEKIMMKIAEPILIKKHAITITTSIGICLYPKDGADSEILIKNADSANHLAKEERNCFKFFTLELNINAEKRIAMENYIRLALERNEFLLHYQPIVNISTGKIVAVEALLRWRHPKLGLIPPQEFIPVAEETGLMLPIGDWVLKTACLQNKQWQDQGLPAIQVAVNFTAKQLSQTNIVEKISTILKTTGLSPKFLELELVESALIEGTDRIVRTLQELKNLGIKITIDDFGTGYSSLSYLNRLPLDKIKIDRSFIEYIGPNPSDVAVILAIIAMSKSLGVTVLAEGVEAQEQLDFLHKHHCDETQGYYLCRPQPVEDITSVLAKKKIS